MSTTDQVVTTYRVSGMTCGHCETAVQRELGTVPGVTDVRVDLASGDVTVTSARPLPIDAVTEAIDEAGYQLA